VFLETPRSRKSKKPVVASKPKDGPQWPLAQSASDFFSILDLLGEERTLNYGGTYSCPFFTSEEYHRLMREALPKQFKDSDWGYWEYRAFDEQHFLAAISSLKEASELGRLASLMADEDSGFANIIGEYYGICTGSDDLPTGDEATLPILSYLPEWQDESVEDQDFYSWNESYVGHEKAAGYWEIAFHNYRESLETEIGGLLERLNEPDLAPLVLNFRNALKLLDEWRVETIENA